MSAKQGVNFFHQSLAETISVPEVACKVLWIWEIHGIYDWMRWHDGRVVVLPHDNRHNVLFEPLPQLLGYILITQWVLKGEVEHVVLHDRGRAVLTLATATGTENVNLDDQIISVEFVRTNQKYTSKDLATNKLWPGCDSWAPEHSSPCQTQCHSGRQSRQLPWDVRPSWGTPWAWSPLRRQTVLVNQ